MYQNMDNKVFLFQVVFDPSQVVSLYSAGKQDL